jgi:hypothetical protein
MSDRDEFHPSVVIKPPPAEAKTGAGDVRVQIRDAQLPLDSAGEAQETPSAIAKRHQQWVMVGVCCTVFVALNLVVVALIWYQLRVEDADIVKGLLKPAERTITAGVFMALIGATVVQTGYAIRTIMRYLF